MRSSPSRRRWPIWPSSSAVGHGDVKPGNLYELDGRWLVGDFGLIDVPALDELTRSDRPMGPVNFMAYEMISDPAGADSKPADVYSLGKTLWSLTTEVPTPPLGHQPVGSSGFRIYDLRPHAGASELDGLIDRMTSLDPGSRPTMREAQSELETWRSPRPERPPIDVAALGARFRSTRSGELAAREQREQQRAQALEAVRELQQQSKPLNDALRQIDNRFEIDAMGRPADREHPRRAALSPRPHDRVQMGALLVDPFPAGRLASCAADGQVR